MGKKEGGSTEGRMDGGREGGIRNWEHLAKLGGRGFFKVLVGSGEFWKALEGYGWPWPALGGFVWFQFLPDMSKKKLAEIPR